MDMKRFLTALLALAVVSCGRTSSSPQGSGTGDPGPNASASGSPIPDPSQRKYLLERVDDAAVVQLYADGFEKLPLREKTLIWHLYQAAIAGRDIFIDQKHRSALEMRSILDQIVAHPQGIDPATFAEIQRYTKLFWINNGPYNNLTARKFVLTCTPQQFADAAKKAAAAGATFPTRANETLDQSALDLARDVANLAPTVLEQVGAFSAAPARQPSSDARRITILYFGLLPTGTAFRSPHVWVEVSEAPASLAPRQREEIDAALATLRVRVDQQPIAFRLLPAIFTLSELQRIYELLLGRKLHKASFRRALHAASLVEATDEWRSEGRGRPAQLFRYAPPRRRRARRGVRFDALG